MDDEEDIELQRQRLDSRSGDTADPIADEPREAHAPLPDTEPAEPTAAPTAGQRLSQQARLRRPLVAAGAVVLAVVVLAALLPNTGATLRALLGIPTPVPTAPPAIGAGTFLIVDTVPWGTLLVDGHPPSLEVRQPNEPVGAGPPAPTFVLGQGRHTVEYRAAPFQTLRCVVSVPAAANDTCPLAREGAPNDPVRAFGAARVLDLLARPALLPPEQQAALEQTILATLNAGNQSAEVYAGERYLGADGAIHVAPQPLMASLVYLVNQDLTQALPGDTGPCVALCRSYDDDQPPSDLAGTNSWLIAVHLVLTWRYTLPNGTVLAQDVPAAPVASDAHELAVLGVQWNGTWKMTDLTNGLGMLNVVPSRMLDEAITAAGGQSLANNTIRGACLLGSPPEEGCLFTVTPQVGTQGLGPAALVLYRFGVLLAANGPAQQLLPALPAADAQEQALAQKLLAPGGQG